MTIHLKCRNCERANYYGNKYSGYCLDCWNAGVVEKDGEICDLRDAIRLMIGRREHRRWFEVTQEEVDSWVEEVRELKRKAAEGFAMTREEKDEHLRGEHP